MAAMPDSLLTRLPENWPRALWAGLEAVVLTWLLAVSGGMVSYVTTAAAPGVGHTSWGTAVDISTRWWLLAFGGTAHLREATMTLAPLGLTAVAVVLVRGAARRLGVATGGEAAFTVLAFTAGTGLLSLCAAVREGPYLLGAALAAALGVLAAWHGRLQAPWARWVRPAVAAGMRAAALTFVLVAAAGTALVLAAVVASWDEILQVHASLQPDVASTVVLVLLQLAYLPNAALWALAWLAGPGFSVGAGTSWTVSAVHAEALPAVPLLAALPAPGEEPGMWVYTVLVVLGLLGGLWHARRSVPEDWRGFAVTALTVFLSLGAAFTAWGLLSSGSIGPGRMSEVGVQAALAGPAIAAWAAAGTALALVARMPQAWATLAAAFRAALRRPRPDLAAPASAAVPGTVGAAVTVPTAPSAVEAPGD